MQNNDGAPNRIPTSASVSIASINSCSSFIGLVSSKRMTSASNSAATPKFRHSDFRGRYEGIRWVLSGKRVTTLYADQFFRSPEIISRMKSRGLLTFVSGELVMVLFIASNQGLTSCLPRFTLSQDKAVIHIFVTSIL